ncbi:hypothetical protein HCC70_04820 [Streptococcus suis]|uniref:Uncharacterized protein n=1 Tax=Streptococcus suivaginalis TaxID=3028082 RepID=A0AA96VEJ1_9STRE|nr:hypothetical protein [Streptococcus sp. 29896]MCK4027654.1 hypothetical protein [Streptococcus suis]WNY47184.1 hypothetical protein PXH68_00260 [Streptococcus sp. 29896]
MLLFSTILNIDESLTHDKFIELVIKWNQGSPHTDNVISGINWCGERNIKFTDKNLWLDIQEYRNKNIIAVRFEKNENGIIWDTDYVMNFDTMKMSVILDRSFTDSAEEITYSFATPYFITLLIREGYLKDDKELKISDVPIEITEKNIQDLASIINGDSDFRLPVVYVSKTSSNQFPLDVCKLARTLKGVAHVFVQNTTSTNSQLRELCNGKNDYSGAVGIYFPNQVIPNKRFIYSSYQNGNISLRNRIVNSVLNYHNTLKIDVLSTWQGVNNALLYDKLQSQKQKRNAALIEKKDTESILEEFDEELKALELKVRELTQRNDRLIFENQSLKAKVGLQSGTSVIDMGAEEEFFVDEVKEFILSVLNSNLDKMNPDSRRFTIISDIVASNNFQALLEEKSNTVKDLLSNYTGMTTKLRNSLKNLGFDIREEGKHYKLIYFGDNRYTFTIAKTPSDKGRAGKNNVSTINKKIF